MTMIGRKKEIDELNRLYNSNNAELVVVFGKRRVGKSSTYGNEKN